MIIDHNPTIDAIPTVPPRIENDEEHQMHMKIQDCKHSKTKQKHLQVNRIKRCKMIDWGNGLLEYLGMGP